MTGASGAPRQATRVYRSAPRKSLRSAQSSRSGIRSQPEADDEPQFLDMEPLHEMLAEREEGPRLTAVS
jgi:hypothetical protein